MAAPAKAVVSPKFKRILFATDFSPCSAAALAYVSSIAQRYGSTVHAVHVVAPEPRRAIPLDQLPAEINHARQSVREQMVKLLSGDALKDVVHWATIERGPIWEVIAALIQQEDIDLVVAGTHGRRGFSKLVLGSVAEQIFRLSPCPVLTVGPAIQREGLAEGNLSTVLFATNFSAASLRALPYALSIAKEHGSRLVLLHAVQDSTEVIVKYLGEAVAEDRRRLTDLLASDTGSWCTPEIVVECGPAADTILKIAAEKSANLIVMGAHRASLRAVSWHLPWAISSVVVSRAQCPVLTVRS